LDVITSTRYKTITDEIDNTLLSDNRSLSSASKFNLRLEIINGSFNVSLTDALESTSNLIGNLTSQDASPSVTDSLISALQQHIIDSGFDSIDDFLSDNSLHVRASFASRSIVLGYTISNEFIE